jgi:hypothetical protein
LLTSGEQYRQHQFFGGLRNGSALTSPSGDSLYRFAPIPGGQWDDPIYPDGAPGSQSRPTPRYGHSAIAGESVPPFWGQVYFGGHDAAGLQNDTWIQQIYYYTQLRSTPQYQWVRPTVVGGLPLKRSDHSAIAALDTCMMVFGGLGENNATLSDVWRFTHNATDGSYKWTQISHLGGTGPTGGRYGHAAIYDTTLTTSGDTLRRMIVFGGTSYGNSPSDPKVWELRFVPGVVDSATWYEVQVDTLGSNGKPSARYWHTMNVDMNDHVLGQRGPCHVAFMFGGKLDTGACSDTLWRLWVFRTGHVGWERIPPPSQTLPGARARHSMVLDSLQSAYGGRLYLFGGIDQNGNPMDNHMYVIDLWGGRYSSSTGTPAWTQWGDLAYSLAGQTALLDRDQQDARMAEVYDPATDIWTAHTSATMRQTTYPPVFLVPGGNGASRVISINNDNDSTYSLTIPASGQAGGWVPLNADAIDCLPQAAVLYRPDHIMVAGGLDKSPRVVTGKTRVLDVSNLANGWAHSADLVPRLAANLVLLPTGQVLAVGGNQLNDSDLPIRWPQLWDPNGNNGTGTWTDTLLTNPARLAAQPTIRAYHSTAILLPDGRVLSAGGSDNQGDATSDQHTANIFDPPYLFDTNGALAVRPTFSSPAKPESLGYGKVFTTCVPSTDGLTRACLIRPGATTHSFDENQRYVPLTFASASNPTRLLVMSPASPDSAPPGDYMLFVTGKGANSDVPSIARWVWIGATGLDSCDVVPPNIVDLYADCDPNTTNGWIVSWMDPADDLGLAASGPAARFDMRTRSAHIVTASDWTGATHINTPTPGTVGTTQSVSIISGSPQRYLRMLTKDDNNNPAVDSLYLGGEVMIFPWTSGHFDCGGSGMSGGGGGGGYSAGRAPGYAAAQAAGALSVPENSLLPGARAGVRSSDAWRLASGLGRVGTSYSFYLHERSGRAAALDQVRLVAVDHAAGLEALSLPSGFTLGNRQAAAGLTRGDGTDLTAALAAGTPVPASGETLSVNLGRGNGTAPLVVAAAGSWPCGIDVLVPDGQGGWVSRGRIWPRRGMDALTLDPPGSEAIRLAVMGSVSLQFVGTFAISSDAPTVQTAALASAQDSQLGDVTALVGASDNVSATLAGPDTLALSFAPPALAGGLVRDYFLIAEATPVTAKAAAQLQHAGEAPTIPTRFALRQNRPNPFNAATVVWFDLPVGAMVRLEVFDAQGRRIETLANRYFPAGSHAVPWNPMTAGRRIGPGVYFYRIEAGAFRARKKMTLIP